MIRRATAADIPAMLAMGAKFHAYSGLSEIDYDPASFRATLEAGLEADNQAYFVVDDGGKLVGMTGGIVYPSYFNHDALTGQEMFWWCDGGRGLKLYQVLEDWAISKGCASFSMVALDDAQLERMGRIYKKLGYRPSEHSFIKRFK